MRRVPSEAKVKTMNLSSAIHIYFGSSFCGPFEAFLKLRTKNLLFEPHLRHPSFKQKVALRRIDLVLRDECKRITPIVMDALSRRLDDPRPESDDPNVIKAAVAHVDAMVFDMIYPTVGSLALLRSALGEKVSSDEDIHRLLAGAEKLVSLLDHPDVKEVAEARHDGVRRAIQFNGSYGFYCLFVLRYTKNENYQFKALNEQIGNSFNNILLSLSVSEQREVFQMLGTSEEEIAGIYIDQARILTQDQPGDLLKLGVSDSMQQFWTFVLKGKEFGFFAGWGKSEKFPSKRDVCINLNNPIIQKIAQEEKWKLPE